jgi:hypothetical protein
MTNQTESSFVLGRSPARFGVNRISTPRTHFGSWAARIFALPLVAALIAASSLLCTAQEQPAPAPATPAPAAPAQAKPPATPPAAESKPSEGKKVGNYQVHQMIELGGHIVDQSGSDAMYATMVNQTAGFRVLAQSLTMHSTNTAKTPFFDVLNTNSYGYGGDPYDATFLNVSKGRWWDFAGNFRRDRNYFDYNVIVQPYLTTATPINPVLIPTPSTLHLYNTVRRSTDTLLTLFPVSMFHVRVGYNHGTHEGPTLNTIHGGGDVQLSQWFRNSLDTYVGGVDANLAKRTTLSYDQFLGFYRGDTTYQLAPTPIVLPDGTPVSLGVSVLTGPGVTCGSNAFKTINVVNGVANPFCSGTITQNWTAPTRTSFPTEQFRFVSHYWDRIGMNGRGTYSGGVLDVNHFNQTFNGLVSRTSTRQEILTGALADGRLAHNKRINVNADFSIDAELNKYISLSDTFNFWNFRIPGNNAINSQVWGYNSETGPAPSTFSMLTPVNEVPLTTTISTNTGYLSQKNTGNTILAVATITPQVKISGGWRFNDREIKYLDDPTLAWHQNWALLGGVIQPSQMLRLNINYEGMSSSAANSATTTNTYTREMPNSIEHLRARALVNAQKWINFAVAYNGYFAKNTDPLVNHRDHNQNFSIGTHIAPAESFSLDLNYGYDNVFSRTDLCYQFTPNPQAPLPAGAVNAGTCTAANGGGTSFYLGDGYYSAPVNFFNGSVFWAPSKYFAFNGGIRLTDTSGNAEYLNPLVVPGSLESKIVSPFTDLVVNIAPQWAWHGNWVHHGYNESGGPGPGSRDFHGDVFTLGVRYAF